MQELLAAASSNFLSPPILAFLLGCFAGAVRSELEVPAAIAKGLSIYLMLAIGLKGGASLRDSGVGPDVLLALLAAGSVSFLLPLLAFALLRVATGLGRVDAAAVSAHYGSVSVVTFVTATQFLDRSGIGYEGYMVAMVAVMETPAIITALLLAGAAAAMSIRRADGVLPGKAGGGRLLREILFNGSILLLLGGFVIGWASGDASMARVEPFFVDLFQGVLCLFLLDMGLVVARRIGSAEAVDLRLVLFGLYMPVLGAAIGGGLGLLIGLSPGGTFLFAVLAASASYIAVPAAIRLALPRANPGIYLTLSLGVTFPFNIMIGIPVYAAVVGLG